MVLLGVLFGIGQAAGVVARPVDAIAYWAAGTSTHLYPQDWATADPGMLFYPPVTAQFYGLLQPLGWPVFIVAWTTLLFACFWYCARGWSLLLVALGVLVIAGLPLPAEAATFLGYALLGNMQWALAALVLVALEHPSSWAVMALTKTTPAVAGLWHLLRAEWRPLAISAGVTLSLFAVSFALWPSAWFDWIGFVSRNASMANPPLPMFPVPLVVRLPIAVLIVVWGARTGRSWTVPVSAGCAIPALYGLGFLPFWVGALSLAGVGPGLVLMLVRRRLAIAIHHRAWGHAVAPLDRRPVRMSATSALASPVLVIPSPTYPSTRRPQVDRRGDRS